jgi:hypothetical protein
MAAPLSRPTKRILVHKLLLISSADDLIYLQVTPYQINQHTRLVITKTGTVRTYNKDQRPVLVQSL